jgi:hypothetical protein
MPAGVGEEGAQRVEHAPRVSGSAAQLDGTRAQARAEAARSTQISPLTDAPSAAEKLPVFSVPVNTPDGMISTRVDAERLPRTTPPIWIAAALMLASTCAPSATKTLPETLISPSNLPWIWKSPSPLISRAARGGCRGQVRRASPPRARAA